MINEKPKMPGIFLKSDWNEMFSDLSNEETGKLIKNCYHYINNEVLLEMDRLEAMVFYNTIVPVLEFNIEKYIHRCETNSNSGKKGGRPSKSKKQNEIFENPEKPNGYSGNPQKPKEKERVIDKDRGTINDIESVTATDINKEIATYTLKTKSKSYLNKFRVLSNLDCNTLMNEDEYTFCTSFHSIISELAWDEFEQLIFNIEKNDVSSFLSKYNAASLEPLVYEVRTHFPHFLDRIIK